MGEFEQYTVDDIREIVDPDRPPTLRRQAAHWGTVAALYRRRAAALGDRLAAVRPSWRGAAAEAFYAEVERVRTDLRSAAEIARSNQVGWSAVADEVAAARTAVLEIHRQWQTAKGGLSAEHAADWDALAVANGTDRGAGLNTPSQDEARRPYDEAARAAMDTAAQNTADVFRAQLQLPERFELPPEVAPPPGYRDPTGTDRPSGTDRTDERAHRSEPRNGPEPTDDKPGLIDGHGPTEDTEPGLIDGQADDDLVVRLGDEDPTFDPDRVEPSGPRLQNPGPVAPSPAAPGPPPGPSGPTPAPGPGPIGVVPPARLVLPPAGPVPPAVRPGPPPVGLTPNTSGTVRPVIGARPGSTGMAPDSTGRPGPGAMSRPVIGARTGQPPRRTVTPKRPLIGTDGVRVARTTGAEAPQRGVIRAAGSRAGTPGPDDRRSVPEDRSRSSASSDRSRSGAAGTSGRSERRTAGDRTGSGGRRWSDPAITSADDGTAEWWRPRRPVVPSVIAADHRPIEHDRGPVITSTGADRDTDDRERAVVARLSRRETEVDSELWRPPATTPGVITTPEPDPDPVFHHPGTVFGGR